MQVSIDSTFSPDESRRRIAKAFKRKLSGGWPYLPSFGEREMRYRIEGDRVRVAYQGSTDRYSTSGAQTRRFFDGRLVSTGVGCRLEGQMASSTGHFEMAVFAAAAILGGLAFLAGKSVAGALLFLAILAATYARITIGGAGRESKDNAQSEIRAIIDRLTGALEPDAGSLNDPHAADRLKWGA